MNRRFPATLRCVAAKHGSCRSAFTLIELLAVMTLVVILFSSAVGMWLGMKRGEAMRGAIALVRGEIGAARDFALSHSRQVTMNISSNQMRAYYRYDLGGSTGTVDVVIREKSGEFLPPEIYLTDENGNPLNNLQVQFHPSGTAGFFSNQVFQLRERGGRAAYELTIQALTGDAKFRNLAE